MSSNDQPYTGPRPFSERDQEIFFGRDREAQELLSLIVSHSETLLYAKAGAGKTSLINAGVIPLLKRWEECEILPVATMRAALSERFESKDIANIYIFNTLISWDGGETDPAVLARLSLSEFLKRSNHSRLDEDDLVRSLIIIFDHFEEIFTLYPERWQERADFFVQLGKVLEEDRSLRVVFAMREDFIGELDSYVHLLPQKLRNRFRLEPLRAREALMALVGPTQHANRRFAPGVAETLVDNLLQIRVMTLNGPINVTGQFVDAVQLQIVSQELWQRLAPEETEITQEHLAMYGEVDSALARFYEEAIRQTVQETGIEESALRRWFELHLITPLGTRGTVYRGAESSGGIPNTAVDRLEEQLLIRSELRGAAVWYELSHDRLIQPIQQSNQRWLANHSSSQQTQLEKRAQEWLKAGRPQTGLLDGKEIEDAEQLVRNSQSLVESYNEAVFSFVLASRAALEAQEQARMIEQRRAFELRIRNRRLRYAVTTLTIVTLLSLALFVISWLR